MIQIRDLEFRYPAGDFRLRVADLSVEAGATVAVIGPSGSGKTTLLNLVAGILPPQQGRVVVEETDLTAAGESARRRFRIRRIGLVFQEFELLEYLNVLDNILLPYRINGSLDLTRAVRDRGSELAEEVGISTHLNRYVRHLSQGERQRVSVCRALLAEPPLLLADEPTGNLDPTNKDRVLDILFDYSEKSGATLVTVTHDHDLLPRFARIIDFKAFYDIQTPEAS